MSIKNRDKLLQELMELSDDYKDESYKTGANKVRLMGQGALFGFGDELEAALRSIVDEREYEEIRDEIRNNLNRYRDEYGKEAMALELSGAIIPALLTLGGGGALSAARTAGTAGWRNLFKRGATEGAVSGVGFSEQEGAGSLKDAPLGAALGGATNLGLTKAAEGFMGFAKKSLGERSATKVQNELLRLAENTGKSVDEIIEDVTSGRIMADNQTLAAALKAYRGKGGKAAAMIDENLPKRAQETKNQALETLQKALARVEGNLVEKYRMSDDAMKKAETERYSDAFKSSPEVPSNVANTLEEIFNRMPKALKEVEKQLSESGMPSLVEITEEGAKLKRPPSLEEAEIVRRILRDTSEGLFKKGKGTRAEPWASQRRGLESQLDEFSPELKEARQIAHEVRQGRESYTEGHRALGDNVEKLEDDFNRLLTDPQKEGYRYGAMEQIKHRTKNPTNVTIQRIGNPQLQEGGVLDAILPDNADRELIQRQLNIAGDSAANLGKITQHTQTAEALGQAGQIGKGPVSLEEMAVAATGNPIAIGAVAVKKISELAPDLDANQREQVVRILFETSPEIVKEALTGKGNVEAVLTPLIKSIAETVRMGTVQQTSGKLSKEITPAITSGVSGLLEAI